MFFYANKGVTIDEAAFWEMSYMLRARGSQVDSSSSLIDSESIRKKESSNQELTAARAAVKASNQVSVDILCPVFLKDIARAIVSAGKSFQLIEHFQDEHRVETCKGTWGLMLIRTQVVIIDINSGQIPQIQEFKLGIQEEKILLKTPQYSLEMICLKWNF